MSDKEDHNVNVTLLYALIFVGLYLLLRATKELHDSLKRLQGMIQEAKDFRLAAAKLLCDAGDNRRQRMALHTMLDVAIDHSNMTHMQLQNVPDSEQNVPASGLGGGASFAMPLHLRSRYTNPDDRNSAVSGVPSGTPPAAAVQGSPSDYEEVAEEYARIYGGIVPSD